MGAAVYQEKRPERHAAAVAQRKGGAVLADNRGGAGGRVLADNRGAAERRMTDNSPQAVKDRALQAMMNNSARAHEGRALQAMINNGSQAREAQAFQRMANVGARTNSPVQRVEEEEPLQAKAASEHTAQLEAAAEAPRPNNTGLPDNLKTGIESLSGMSMDHVKVHYNSAQPAQLNAHAYAQGSEIHVAPGQEQHVPHEAWHVVQQAQGRVRPTMQMKGNVNVNDDAGLEKEADVMGAKTKSLDTANYSTLDSDFQRTALNNLSCAQTQTIPPKEVAPRLMQVAVSGNLASQVTQLLEDGEKITLENLGFSQELIAKLHDQEFTLFQLEYLHSIGFTNDEFIKLFTFGVKHNQNDLFYGFVILNGPPLSLTAKEIVNSYRIYNGNFADIKTSHKDKSHKTIELDAFKVGDGKDVFKDFCEEDEPLFRAFLTYFNQYETIVLSNTGKKARQLAIFLNGNFDFDEVRALATQTKFSIKDCSELLRHFNVLEVVELAKLSLTVDQLIDFKSVGATMADLESISLMDIPDFGPALLKQFEGKVYSDINWINTLHCYGFSIQNMIDMTPKKDSFLLEDIKTVRTIYDLPARQISELIYAGIFDEQWVKDLSSTKLAVADFQYLRSSNTSPLYTVDELRNLCNFHKFTYKELKELKDNKISYEVINDLNQFNFSTSKVTKFACAGMKKDNVEQTKKNFSDKSILNPTPDFFLTEHITKFSIEDIKFLKEENSIAYKDIQEFSYSYTANQIRFLINNNFAVKDILKLHKSKITYDTFTEYFNTGLNKEIILSMVHFGLDKDSISDILNIADISTVNNLINTEFSLNQIKELGEKGFSITEIIKIRNSTKEYMETTKVYNEAVKEPKPTIDELIRFAQTNLPIADIREYIKEGVDSLEWLQAFAATRKPINEIISIFNQLSINTPDINNRIQIILKLAKTKYTTPFIVEFLKTNLTADEITMLNKTSYNEELILKCRANGDTLEKIVMSAQIKFSEEALGIIFNEKTSKYSDNSQKIEDILNLANVSYSVEGIDLLFKNGFEIEQIITLGKSKFSTKEIDEFLKIKVPPAQIAEMAETGYFWREIEMLYQLVGAKSIKLDEKNKLKIVYNFGTNGYSFPQSVIVLNHPYFLKVTKELQSAENILKKFSYNQILFLAEQTELVDQIDLAALASTESIETGKKEKKTGGFDVSSWIPLWQRAVFFLKNEISEWEENYAFPDEDTVKETNEAIYELNVKNNALKDLSQLATNLSIKITNDHTSNVDKILAKSNIKDIAEEISKIIREIEKQGEKSPAMSAKGRSPDRPGVKNALNQPSFFPTDSTTRMYGGIKIGTLGGEKQQPTDVFNPYDQTHVPAKGVINNPGHPNIPMNKRQEIGGRKGDFRQLINNLAQPNDPKNVDVIYYGPATRQDRGSGQATAMAGLNAATYAFALGLITDENETDWEWLHIRAAGLGGATNSRNLLPGIAPANTLMIPIENNLKHLANLASPKTPLTVTYAPENNIDDSNSHAYRNIKIIWKMGGNANKDNLQTGEATFDIINSRVVTKGDIAVLEAYLKTNREVVADGI